MPRLMHPLHGWHVTSAGDDIEAMRRAGWVDDDGKALAAKLATLGLAPAPVLLGAAAPVAPLVAAKRGPGRPRKG